LVQRFVLLRQFAIENPDFQIFCDDHPLKGLLIGLFEWPFSPMFNTGRNYFGIINLIKISKMLVFRKVFFACTTLKMNLNTNLNNKTFCDTG
jgi:hypothetical protein